MQQVAGDLFLELPSCESPVQPVTPNVGELPLLPRKMTYQLSDAERIIDDLHQFD